ncbi:MAG: glycosyltransferase family 39 protein [Candidatus Omnitrophota bacterium]
MKYFFAGLLRRNNIVLFAIFAFGFLLRIYRLEAAGLWHDELMTISRISYPFVTVIRNLSTSSFPPLYYMLMNIWEPVFGRSELAIRLPSLIFSVLSIIAIYNLAKEMFDRNAGLFSAALLSICPFSIYYAQEAKMYSMLWFFMIISFLYFHKFLISCNRRHLTKYIIFTSLSLYTMYIGFIFVIIQNAIILFYHKKKQIKWWVFAQLVLLVMYLPWIRIFLYNAYRGTGIEWIKETTNYTALMGAIFTRTIIKIPIGHVFDDIIAYYLLIASSFLTFSKNTGKKIQLYFSKPHLVLIAWIIIPAIIYIIINLSLFPIIHKNTLRYIGFIHIPMIILAGYGITKYSPRIRPYITLLLIALIFSVRIIPLYPYIANEKNRFRNIMGTLCAKAGGNSVVATSLPLDYAGYYNQGHQILQFSNRNGFYNKIRLTDYESIFVLYPFSKNELITSIADKGLKGYILADDYSGYAGGFLWFKKAGGK